VKITGKRSLSSRLWLDRQRRDLYVKQARREGYRSRAVFKLMEMDDKFHLTKNAKTIVDLGAAPGGWCQLLSERVEEDARIAAIDLVNFPSIPRVEQFIGDFTAEENQQKMVDYFGCKIDLVLSDMAPSSIGHPATDHQRLMNLVRGAHRFVKNVLTDRGNFITKIFQGGEEKKFFEELREDFEKVCFFKPKSSRSPSAEIYVVALGFKKCT
jgi:23S rRNA (uridine2552-2'-O)-methyltransferase